MVADFAMILLGVFFVLQASIWIPVPVASSVEVLSLVVEFATHHCNACPVTMGIS